MEGVLGEYIVESGKCLFVVAEDVLERGFGAVDVEDDGLVLLGTIAEIDAALVRLEAFLEMMVLEQLGCLSYTYPTSYSFCVSTLIF